LRNALLCEAPLPIEFLYGRPLRPQELEMLVSRSRTATITSLPSMLKSAAS